jgi:hypothetical protein
MYIDDYDWQLICEATDRLVKLEDDYNDNVEKMCHEMDSGSFCSKQHQNRQAKTVGMILATIFTLKTSIKYAKTLD